MLIVYVFAFLNLCGASWLHLLLSKCYLSVSSEPSLAVAPVV